MKSLAQIDIGTTFLGGATVPRVASDVSPLVSRILVGAISVSGTILLFLLIFGGIGIISGAGQNDPQKMAQGKKAATAALIGFIVIITAYWIVQLIGQITGVPLIGVPIT